MTTYVNESLVGVTSETDPNYRIRRYEYDGLQRLISIKDEKRNILKTFDYNYKDNNTAPMWAGTTEKRCRPCPQNGNYHTADQEIKQVDVNPNSPTYKNERWYNMGATGACTVQADWQNISGPTCLLNSNGFNTGFQRFVQQDKNPCSGSFNTTRNNDVANYTACPSNEPNWQPTDEIRCQPCSNPVYNTKIQQRKWIDQNPNSNTGGTTEWRATGVQCATPPDYQYTSTPPTCQLNSFGWPTGWLMREKKDMNPCSDSYGFTYWSYGEQNHPSCPAVYWRIVYTDYKYQGTYSTNDVYIAFYQYINGVEVPYNVSNISFTMEESHASNNCEWFSNYRQFTGISGNYIKLYEDVTSEYETPPDCYTYVSFSAQIY
jgi:YD repeat-containing protein